MSLLLFQRFFDKTDHFTRFGVAASLKFRVYQRIVYLDLEPASIRGDESHFFDLRFVLL